jgi:hypothetical protein
LDIQKVANQRRAISAFGAGRAKRKASLPPEVAPHGASVSLGIVGHDGSSTQSRVRFRSGRLWRPERHGACLLPWSLPFYFCQPLPRVILLVFLLASATIDDEN